MVQSPDLPPRLGPPPFRPDPVIEAYKPGIDRTLVVENLRRTPEERLTNLAAVQRFVSRLRGAARNARPDPAP